MFKHWLKRCHLILALVSGIFLINISLSGFLLLFAKDIQTIIHPQYWLIDTQKNTAIPTDYLPLSVLINNIENKTGSTVSFIELPEHSNSAWRVKLSNNTTVNMDPFTAEILLTHHLTDTFYGFVMSWHRWLLYKNGQNDKPMQLVVASASLMLIFQLLIGCYLWLKPKHRLKRFKINQRANFKVKLYQLHGSVGIVCTIPLLLIAFSGITFYWSEPTKNIVELLTGSDVQQHNFKPPQRIITQADNTLSLSVDGIDKAYNAIKNVLPNSTVFRIYPPKTSSDVVAFRVKTMDETHANSWAWAIPQTGEILDSFDSSKQSLATQVWNFRYKFHIGEFIGLPIKFIWLFFSLLPTFFVITGVYFWLKRKRYSVRRSNIA